MAQVSILSLVRDAAARMPGGAGTRADFILLLRDSQYFVEDAPDREVVLSVSGALDRLQHETSNNGPCIEYDNARRVGHPLSLPNEACLPPLYLLPQCRSRLILSMFSHYPGTPRIWETLPGILTFPGL